MNSTISGSVRQNLIILMCNVLIYSGLFAQSSVCPIGVPMAPSKTNEQNSTSMVRDIMSTNSVKWDSLTNVKFSDNHKTRISLPSAKRSRAFVGSNLNFQVPVGATIDGIMITVEGRSTNRTNIDELQVHLLDSMGMPIGLNKANTAAPQNAWDNPLSGDDHMWMYGSPTDTWGIDWTPEMVNNTNFGYMFQLRNRNTTPVDVSVDQIVVTVFYSELLTACDDKCLTFYIDKLETMGSYKWHVPVGFRMVSHYLNDQTIDLKIVDAKFGIHEICVDVYDQSGNFVETCCRDFLYQDCTSSVIDGQVWLDYNDNKMRDFNEGILPNVRLVLFNQNNQPVDTVFSNAAGKYRFTDLPAGKFYVQVPDVTNHAIIKKTGNDPDRDSDVTDANGPSTTDLIMTIIAKTVFNVDFGYTPLVNIGDYVWLDANFDGLQTSGEVGIAGVKVVLMNEAGLRIDSTTTNDEGRYIFQNKPANKYRLKFEDVGNSLLATFKNPTNTALNSDIDSLGRTLLYTIITAGTRDDIDAGYYKPASISGLAWDDKNGDGIRTDNELPLSNVAISLKGQSGNGQNIIRNTQTNDAGSYIFTKLPPGTYTLDWNLPTDYHWTALNQGSNDAMDSDVALDSLLGPLTVTSGDSLINNDGGAYRYGSIGDFVWEDINGNGLQDVNEPGIADAIITLWKNGVEVGSITSGDDGLYTLDSIVPGTYTVRIEIDGEYLPIMEDVGFDDAVDSDADVNGNVVGVAVMSGMAMNTIDAGFYRPSTMGDFVWEDMNANGIQDIGEPGLVNVNVVLSGLSNTGLPVSLTTITNTQGQYLLEGLAPGMYNINFTAAAQYNITAVDKGIDNTKDSDIDALGNVMNISVTSGSTNNDIDAGYYEYAQVGNFVWEDMNANGSQDADELGISNVALTLTGTDGAGNVVTLNMTTNADGAYAFTNIIPGSYQISAQIGQEYQQTKANSTTADKDSDFDNNASSSFTLVSAENKDSIDAGYFRYAELGNFTWVDANGNGLQDINENGLSGVLVTLTGVNGFGDNITRMSITNTSGIYIFDNLIPGTYGINFGVSQDKLYTISNAGDDARDSDPIEGSVTNITLISNQKNETIDAGYLMPVEIGDFVWEDTNTNGIQDANEPGLQGLSVTLTGTDVLGMTVNEIVETNESGLYFFEKVYPGTYTIALSYTDPFIPTKFKMGTATLVDSDLNPDGTSFQLIINSVDDDLSIDFGLVKKGSIGDLVWEDLNCNGAREGDEPGIAGVKVNLTGQNLYNDVVNLATTTDDNGNYIFDNLTPGNYTINPEPPATYSLAPSTINTVNMQSGQNELSIDFPMFRKGSIGDFVWNDDNEDGIQQSTETGLAGVIVQLTSTNLATPVNTQTTTNAQGQYIFDDLKPATYKLTFVAPLNFASTVRNQGQDVTLDSDIGPTGMTNEIVIISNQDETNVDAGFFSLAKGSITGQAFEDMNANGQNEAGDPVLAGIPVTLIAENGTNIGTTVTDAQGIYSFIGLLGGNYKISIGNTPNLNLTDANTGVESTDSDVNVANRESDLFSLATNTTVSNIDAGFFRYGSIGDFVWNDANEDGIQQPTETGINNVKVTINTTPTASTTTDASGKYTFDNLRPGAYVLTFENGLAFAVTSQSQGDVTLDSDINTNGETSAITITSGQVRTDIDAGYFSTAKGVISGQAFEDMNANGQNEAGDPVLAGIPVTLIADNGSTIGTTVTDAQGNYTFIGLLGGDYKITIGSTPNLNLTDANTGADNTDSDVNVANRESALFSLATNTTVSDVDAGFFRYGSIGDFVWNDANEDGNQQSTELGLSNVKVTLLTSPSIVMTTGTSGSYSFSNLRPGSYKLSFEGPQPFVITKQNIGSVEAIDSDIDDDGFTTDIVIVSGQDNEDIDAGYFSTAKGSITGQAFEDMNANGQSEATDPVLSGIKVSLIDANSTVLATETTDATGRYTFTGFAAANYKIRIGDTPGFSITDANIGDDISDSDVESLTRESLPFFLQTNATLDNVDVGFYRGASIGDFVWFDANEDGIQQPNENGIPSVQVTINMVGQPNPNPISVLTDANGKYVFTNLKPANYTLQFATPANFTVTTVGQGTMDLDSDIDATGMTSSVPLTSGLIVTNVDAGYISTAKGSITGQAWEDTNADGQYQANETFLQGIPVTLVTSSGGLVATSTTDQNGNYAFNGLLSGDYKVLIGNTPDYLMTLDNVGDDLTDSDFDDILRETNVITVSTNATVSEIDAGFYKPASLGDFAWLDENEDGIQQAGEVGIANILVTINSTDPAAPFNSIMMTDGGGRYMFGGLRPGRYVVTFTTPTNFTITTQGQGTPSTDSDIDATGKSSEVTIVSGQSYLDIDAGYKSSVKGSIRGQVWEDLNANGQNDAGELGLVNVPVTLLTSNGTVVTSVNTDANGEYAFTALAGGDYKVVIGTTPGFLLTDANIGADATDSDMNTISRESDVITLATNAIINDIDAGLYGLGSVGDFVWNDINKNGIQDGGELGIAGVVVNIAGTGPNLGFIAQTTTNAAGAYTFTGLRPGLYGLKFDTPTGFIITSSVTGNDLVNSDINDLGLAGALINSRDNKTDIDAGYFETTVVAEAVINGLVWEDLNVNGQNEVGEPGLGEVSVMLLRTDGTTAATTITDSNGNYSFSGLAAGDYKVAIALVNSLVLTNANIGADATDSDFDVVTLESAVITLGASQTINDIDAGLYGNGSIGDFVWNDQNKNGLQDAGELGISGVIVNIVGLGTNASFVSQTVTNETGNYLFTNLRPGEYSLTFSTPFGFQVTPSIGNSNDTNSDIDAMGTVTVTINSRQNRTDIDAGFMQEAAAGTISGNIWEDKNGDGQRDADELPIVATSVTLFSVDGTGSVTLVGNSLTNEFGNYEFIGLTAGDYKLGLSGLEPYFVTFKNIGNDLSDSDFDDVTLETDVVTLAGSLTNIDAGLYQQGLIGDYVWFDANEDGIQQAGESGIANMVIVLSSINQTPAFLASTTTDATGRYLFSGIRPGNYNLAFENVSGDIPTIKNASFDRTIDSDLNPNSSATVMLMSGAADFDVDAGFKASSASGIGGIVWIDKNGNGVRDAGELPLSGIGVNLLKIEANGSSTFVGTRTTDATGVYLFNNLASGDYKAVLFDFAPSSITLPNVGSDDIDSDFNPTTLESNVITYVSGTLINNVDGGLYQTASIGDFVWIDANKNGAQDAGEGGLAGVSMVLKNAQGTIVANQTTSSSGLYAFNGLVPGTYTVEATIPSIYRITLPNIGNNDTNSDFQDANGIISSSVNLMSGMDMLNVDLGAFVNKSRILGVAWNDANGDGIRDLAETFIPGLDVSLLDGSGNTLTTTTVDANGKYEFNNLTSGSYRVKFGNIVGKYITLSNIGADDKDSDALGFTARTTDALIAANGLDIINVDAGYVNASMIGDFVWIDTDMDGLQGASEVGQNGMKVYLLDGNNTVIDSTFSNVNPSNGLNGYYIFDNLPYGTYRIRFTLPENFAYTTSNNSNPLLNSDILDLVTGLTNEITLTPGQSRLDIDAGYNILAATDGDISGVAWKDINGDRLRDSNEPLLSGVSVTLKNNLNITIGTTVTDANGAYIFEDIAFGDYYILAPKQTPQLYVPYNGTPRPFDSDFVNGLGDGSTRLFTLFPGSDVNDIDLGYADRISVGDFAWEDLNVNGLVDGNEPGLADVTVVVKNIPGDVVGMAVTNVSGQYLISDIPTGLYKLTFTAPSQFSPTFQDIAQPDINSDIDENGVTDLTNMTVPGPYRDVDAGYLRFGSIGDRVWLDLNGNGFLQPGEPGVRDIKIYLYTESGELRDSTTTDTTGKYLFDKVMPGQYYLEFKVPSTYLVSPAGVGPEDMDSDITETFGKNTTDLILVGSGASITNVDAAIYIPSVIGDFVWDDKDGDGIQDVGEPGVEGVSVFLIAQNGQLIGTDITDAQGKYEFGGLRQRLYFLQFSAPDGYIYTVQGQGPSGALDSDTDESGNTPLISLAHGVKFLEVDCGLIKSSLRRVTGNVWNDLDQDGLRDPSEPAMANTEIVLLDKDKIQLRTTKTNNAGFYSFVVVDQEMHYVNVKKPTEFVFTAKNVQNDTLINSDVNESGISDGLDMLVPIHRYVDAGMFKNTSASIFGKAWADLDGSQLRDAKDSLLSDVLVLLFKQDGQFVKSTKTDITGRYFFSNLQAGKYYIKVPVIDDMDYLLFTGNNQDVDSEITHQFGTGTSRLVTLVSGQQINNFDAGYTLTTRVFEHPESRNAVKVSIYPNPVARILHIQSEQEEIVDYMIFDASGKVLKKGQAMDQQIDIESMAPGMYYIRLWNTKMTKVIPFVKVDNY